MWVKILAWITSFLIIALNAKLVYDQIIEWTAGSTPFVVNVLIIGATGVVSLFLIYLIVLPLIRGEKDWTQESPSDSAKVISAIDAHNFKHIAAALGRDPGDSAIIGRALSLAKAEEALLTLVHVVDTAPAHFYQADVYDEHTREDEQYLLEIAAEIKGAGVAVEIALPHGDPAKELISFAESHGVDLLVMGSHGHRLVGDLLLGQTVAPVRHGVDIPVLVVR